MAQVLFMTLCLLSWGVRNIRSAGRDMPDTVGWVMTLRSDDGLGEGVDEVKEHRAGTGD